MKTYRLRLIGERDGLTYGVKEYEAANRTQAAELAQALCDSGALWWGGQRLIQELVAAPAR